MFFIAAHYFSLLLLTNDKWFQAFKWLGNFWLITAATAVAVSAEWAQNPWPFVAYTSGAAMWVYAGVLMKDRALIGLNAYFVAFDAYAIWIRL